MSLVWGTQIATPVGMKVIEDFDMGSVVLFGSLAAGSGRLRVNWAPMKVEFRVSGHHRESQLAKIRFGNDQQLACTPDQVFLLSTGKVTRADWLVAGRDALVDGSGKGVRPVHEVKMSVFRADMVGITSSPVGPRVSIDEHLLLADGIVAGDFSLGLSFKSLDPSQKAEPPG